MVYFPVYRLDAEAAFDRGVQHGHLAREQIAASVATYQRVFRDFVSMEWNTATAVTEGYADAIARFDPELLEELRGVAKGSDFPFEDILALNCRSELAFTGGVVDGCTALAAFGRATPGETTVLAQNWDWRLSQLEAMVVLLIDRPGRPSITMLTEAGIIGKFGFNSAGLGTSLNALFGEAARADGTPLHIVLRGLLEARTLSDAIETVARANTATPANVVVAQHGSGALDIELVVGDFDVLLPERDTVVHTNHLISPRLAATVRDLGKFSLPDSYPRLARASRLVEEHWGRIDVTVAQNILRDHANHPDSICRHEDEVNDVDGKRLQSVFSLVMNLEERSMFVTDGPPCCASYVSPLGALAAV